MKKIVLSILTTVITSLVVVAPAAALSPSLFYGDYHNYSVTFKEDGEAVVFAKLVFTNSTDTEKNTYSFKAVGSELKELTVLQVQLPQECANYPKVYDSATRTYKCESYRDPDYNSYYYYTYNSTDEIRYQAAKVSNDGLSYTVNLPSAVKADKTSALLIAYTSPNYTKNSFLAKTYSFPTLTIDNRITEAKIGVSVDEGLFLEGYEDYGYCSMGMCASPTTLDSASSATLKSGSSGSTAATSSPITNRSLDNLYASIGSGQKTFQAKSIAPGKPFTAKGRYASSELRLNAKSVIYVIIGALLVIGTIIFLSFKLRKMPTKESADNNTNKWASLHLLSHLIPVASLLPMVGLVGGTFLISTNTFYESVWNSLGNTAQPLVMIFIIMMYGVLISISPIIYGLKYGWRAALSLLLAQTIWVILLLTLILPFLILNK